MSSGAGRSTRLVTVAALFAVSFAGAALVGPHVPGVHAHDRTVLRSYVDPPFDVGQYPSPLAGFRKYTKANKNAPQTLYSSLLFTVHGLTGQPIRIATLDDYNGLTWTAANRSPNAGTVADTFQRVGTDIDDPARGSTVSYSVTIAKGYVDNYSNMWLPEAGALTRVEFTGPSARAHSDYFRYNLATGTGVVPDRLGTGDTYDVTSVLPTTSALTDADDTATGDVAPDASAFLHGSAVDWSGTTGSQAARINALAAKLHAIGKYSDGEPPNQQFLAGHSQGRLAQFVNPLTVVGDDEQFAAAFALMIEQLGTPARVVLGAIPEKDGRVEGKDVHAWVEVQLVDGTWRSIPTDKFMNRDSHPNTTPPQRQQSQDGKTVPPPSRGRPHSDLADANDTTAKSRTEQKHHAAAAGGGGLPAWLVSTARWGGPPVLVIALLCALIVGAKSLRRRRRRTRGTPAARLAKGWTEIVDHARDLGTAMPGGRTRREQAVLLADHDVTGLAHSADARVFGATDPQDGDVTEFWRQVADARKRMSRAVGLRRRAFAAINLASLRPAPARGAR